MVADMRVEGKNLKGDEGEGEGKDAKVDEKRVR